MKDPAALFFISDWLTSTAEMDADCRGWYLNLILHQYDKKDLPSDVESLAQLAGVKFSEFERFKQVFKQVFEQKFKQNENGRLENERAKEILQKRETFIKKRSTSGKVGYLVKVIHEITNDLEEIEHLKTEFDFEKNDIKNKQVLKQVLKQMLKLYRNGNGNGNLIESEYIDFIEKFNSITGKKIRVPDKKFKGQLNARLSEGFTIDEILKAVSNCKKDKYHMENPKYLTPEFITRSDKLQKFLNTESKQRFVLTDEHINK